MVRSPGDLEEEAAATAETRRPAAGRSSTRPNIGMLRGGDGVGVLCPRRSRDLHLDGVCDPEEEASAALLGSSWRIWGARAIRRRRRRRH